MGVVRCVTLLCLTGGLLTANSVTLLAQNVNPSVPLTLPVAPEVPVSPAISNSLLGPSTGTNPLTGLPCSGVGPSLPISGQGALPGTVPLPETGQPTGQFQAPSSIYGTQGGLGPC